jgi:hypothetical protein
MLVGHDTNISNVAGMLDLDWQIPDPRDDAHRAARSPSNC